MFPGADMEKTQAPRRVETAETYRPLTREEIVAELFKYHSPNDVTIPKYAAINQAAKNFAEVVLQNCPSGDDSRRAIQLIREARMFANASIALNGLSLY